jgi:hypothetical protein
MDTYDYATDMSGEMSDQDSYNTHKSKGSLDDESKEIDIDDSESLIFDEDQEFNSSDSEDDSSNFSYSSQCHLNGSSTIKSSSSNCKSTANQDERDSNNIRKNSSSSGISSSDEEELKIIRNTDKTIFIREDVPTLVELDKSIQEFIRKASEWKTFSRLDSKSSYQESDRKNTSFSLMMDFKDEIAVKDIMSEFTPILYAHHKVYGAECTNHFIKIINADSNLTLLFEFFKSLGNSEFIDISLEFERDIIEENEFYKIITELKDLNVMNVIIINAKIPLSYLSINEDSIEKMFVLRNWILCISKEDLDKKGGKLIFDRMNIHGWTTELQLNDPVERDDLEGAFMLFFIIINLLKKGSSHSPSELSFHNFKGWKWQKSFNDLHDNKNDDHQKKIYLFIETGKYNKNFFTIWNTRMWDYDLFKFLSFSRKDWVLMIKDTDFIMDASHNITPIVCDLEFLSIWDCKFILSDDGVMTFDDKDPIKTELEAIKLFLIRWEKLKIKKRLRINFRSFDKYVKMWIIKLNSMTWPNLFSEFETVKSMYQILFRGDYFIVNDLNRLGLPIHTNFFSDSQISELIQIQSSLAQFLQSSTFFLWNALVELPTLNKILALKKFKKIVLIEWVLLLPKEKEGPIEMKKIETLKWEFRETDVKITEQEIMGRKDQVYREA